MLAPFNLGRYAGNPGSSNREPGESDIELIVNDCSLNGNVGA